MRPLIGLLAGSWLAGSGLAGSGLAGLGLAALGLAGLGLAGLGLATSAAAMPLAPVADAAFTHVEYFCSDGFAPRGGRCVATASRDEIDLYEVAPDGIPGPRRHRIRHNPLHTLY